MQDMRNKDMSYWQSYISGKEEVDRVIREVYEQENAIRRELPIQERKERSVWQRKFKEKVEECMAESRWEMNRRRKELEEMYGN